MYTYFLILFSHVFVVVGSCKCGFALLYYFILPHTIIHYTWQTLSKILSILAQTIIEREVNNFVSVAVQFK
jgi:hypothetical protein